MNAILSPKQKALLDIRNLTVSFSGSTGQIQAVSELNLTLYQGETLALVGESGCGKSTTALSILRLLGPEAAVSGQILVEQRDLLSLNSRELISMRGRDIAMIFQEPMTSLNPVYTVGDQIAEALLCHTDLSQTAARKRTIELLDMVKIVDPHRKLEEYPHTLSGGQRQRMMIAMAVACQPKVLVADEPTTALDVTIQGQILELLDSLRKELNLSLLLITHDLNLVSQWADRVAVMYGGKKVEELLAAELFSSATHPYTKGLLTASLGANTDLHYTQAKLPEISVARDSTTQENIFTVTEPSLVHPAPEAPPEASRTVLIAVRNLQTTYRRQNGEVNRALDHVSFDLFKNETLGLVGESGCGKSTLAKTILRLVATTSGSLAFKGIDLTALSNKAMNAHRKDIQIVFQDPYSSLNPRRKVFDILDTALLVNTNLTQFDRKKRIVEMINSVGLSADSIDRYPHEFSGGQRQRIGIARALVLRPSLVILDEPVSALDVSIQAQILNLLTELKSEFELSYLFISHDLSVVRYISDRVLVMHAGKIIEQGSYLELWKNPTNPYTRSLIDAVPRAEKRKSLA